MPEKMLQFIDLDKQTPNKRNIDQRKEDFKEIYDEFLNQKAKEQSSRCSQCGIPFCQIHCPLSNNIPDLREVSIHEAQLHSPFSSMRCNPSQVFHFNLLPHIEAAAR